MMDGHSLYPISEYDILLYKIELTHQVSEERNLPLILIDRIHILVSAEI